jgi:hypothetical protein
MRVVAIAIAVMIASAGCGLRRERRTMPPIALDLPNAPPADAYARLVVALRELGYPAAFADRDYGVVGVYARARTLRPVSTPITFVLQCYLDGHVVMTAIGGPAAGFGDRTVVEESVRREAVALSDALTQRFAR